MNSHYFYDELEPTPEPYPEELMAEARSGMIVLGPDGKTPIGVRLYDNQGRILTAGKFVQNGDTLTFDTGAIDVVIQ